MGSPSYQQLADATSSKQAKPRLNLFLKGKQRRRKKEKVEEEEGEEEEEKPLVTGLVREEHRRWMVICQCPCSWAPPVGVCARTLKHSLSTNRDMNLSLNQTSPLYAAVVFWITQRKSLGSPDRVFCRPHCSVISLVLDPLLLSPIIICIHSFFITLPSMYIHFPFPPSHLSHYFYSCITTYVPFL